MSLHRSLALILAASFSGGVFAQSETSLEDETIFIAVEQALQGARALPWANITVRSRDGVVTLRGVVATMEDIASAGRIASRVRGVTGVSNQIRVADRPWRA